MTGWIVLAALVVLFLLVCSAGGRGSGHTRFTGPPDVPWADDEEDEQS